MLHYTRATRIVCGLRQRRAVRSQEGEAVRWASLSGAVRDEAVNGRVGGWVRVNDKVLVARMG